jgi:6-phosphogluconolactonase
MKMNNLMRLQVCATLTILAVFMATSFSTSISASEKTDFVYIGTYTGAKSKGIYSARFDPKTGQLTQPELAAETKNPTFVAIHPNHRFLYAVGEFDRFQGKPEGAVSAFSIDPKTGALTLLNQQPSGGAGPCHVAVDPKGKCVLVANYGSGSIAALPLTADGKLGEPASVIQHHGSSVNHDRQSGPHAHFITTIPGENVAVTCDLGLDQVLFYDLDGTKAGLKPHDPPFVSIKPGSGPRHLAFHPNKRWAYLINEMGSTITVFHFGGKHGSFSETQTISTLPKDFSGSSSGAEVTVHPNGRFVYGSNRGHDSIAIFSVDPKTGDLTSVGYQSTQGKTPRHFAIDPSGKWLLAENQDSNNIVIFSIDAKTGFLTPTGETIELGAPVCLEFML